MFPRLPGDLMLFQTFCSSDNFTLLRLIFSCILMNWQEPGPFLQARAPWSWGGENVYRQKLSVYRGYEYSILKYSICIQAVTNMKVKVDNLIVQRYLTVPNRCDQIVGIVRRWWQTGCSETTGLRGWIKSERRGSGCTLGSPSPLSYPPFSHCVCKRVNICDVLMLIQHFILSIACLITWTMSTRRLKCLWADKLPAQHCVHVCGRSCARSAAVFRGVLMSCCAKYWASGMIA